NLATHLDAVSTEGCKSNNDRGQKTIEKALFNALMRETQGNGLYDPPLYGDQNDRHQKKNDQKKDKKKENQKNDWLTKGLIRAQSVHHLLNTGVGGGKFNGDNAGPLGYWWGKIAKMWGKPADMTFGLGYHLLKKWKNKLKAFAAITIT